MRIAILLSMLLLFNFARPAINSAQKAEVEKTSEKIVLFFGNSITAGLGLPPSKAFPALVQEKIHKQDWAFKVVNAGLSGETSAGGLRRIGWILKKPADVLVLELGGNDGLRGISPETTKKNLQGIIDVARKKNPNIKIIIAGMQVPPNLGKGYTESFKKIFPELAKENEVKLIPFILEGVGGQAKLTLPDGIHPNAEGHKIVAENVWKVLAPIMKKL